MKTFFHHPIAFVGLFGIALCGCGGDGDTTDNNGTVIITGSNNGITSNTTLSNNGTASNNGTTSNPTNNNSSNNNATTNNNSTTSATTASPATEGLKLRIEVGEDRTFKIPTYRPIDPNGPVETYDFDVDCDSDGVNEAEGVAEYVCTYETRGERRITINGVFPRIFFLFHPNAEDLIAVEDWNGIQWSDMGGAFTSCENLISLPSEAPDLTQVEDFRRMFAGAAKFNQPLDSWDVSSATDMASMFVGAGQFNQPLDSWDVSSVTDMTSMFNQAGVFSQPLGGWDVTSVADMSRMFLSSGLTSAHYDNLLTGWSAQDVQSGVKFLSNAKYSASSLFARTKLENDFNWTITDGGQL